MSKSLYLLKDEEIANERLLAAALRISSFSLFSSDFALSVLLVVISLDHPFNSFFSLTFCLLVEKKLKDSFFFFPSYQFEI